MALRELLVSIDASDTGRERMRFASVLAQAHGASLTAYYSSPTVSDSPGSPDEIADAIEQEFEGELSARKLRGKWMLSGDPIVEDLVEQIKYVDMAILGLGPPEAGESDSQGFRISDVVVSCGRPVLATPISPLPMNLFSRVLVAWDGSREATRALHDAIPLLSNDQGVWVASIGPDGPALAARAVAHLASHGVKADVDISPALEVDVGSELLQRASMYNADLVVAGVYGRSKLGERLFGGASNTLLHQMLVPILLSH